ncbi:MAG TPA: diguanylate cyclase [Gammaproteobacteria bacterium]|nr:diguanylate cyclase [Gammaproteobacteria bacterium]
MNTASVSNRVFQEQITLLYTTSPVRPLLHLIPGIIIYWMVVDFTGEQPARIWLAILAGINVIRFLHICVSRNKIESTSDFRKLSWQFATGCGLVGFTYGTGLAWFMPLLPEILQLATLTVAITVIPGAMVSFSSSKESFFSYLYPKLGIPMLLCLGWGDTFHTYLFLFGVVYLIVILTLFNWYYITLTDSIRIRLQNFELVESLRESNRQLSELSTIDGLTGIANRRHFDELLEKETMRAKREGKPISLLMLDIDFFKQYNDEYGHLKGDECLQEISQALQQKIKRPGDIVARYGGEEFCIIMPDTDQAGALQLAQQIQDGIEQLRIYHGKSTLASHVTVSIGVATLLPTGKYNTREFINAADTALYAAKNEGRNMIKIAGALPGTESSEILSV